MNRINSFKRARASFLQSSWPHSLVIVLCFFPFISPAIALFTGLVFSLIGLRYEGYQRYSSRILQASVVLLGFGMNLSEVLTASRDGFLLTLISVCSVMALGLLLGKLFKVDKNTSLLISSGTAICGGSAIAAVAPIINSKSHQSTFALVVVFVLNAAALFIFPVVGQFLGLGQELFGNWAAIAIHDTSSVVGAGAIYGEEALQVATTVKLIRALWIIPLSLSIAFFNKSEGKRKIKFPWFILYFVFAILISNYLPSYAESYQHFVWLGRRGMVLALFLIGSNISISQLKHSGTKSFAQGILLWVIVSVSSLFFLMQVA